MVLKKVCIFQIPKSYSLQAAGPIFCSGITMYTPLKQWGALKGGMNVGVVGIGGLGQVFQFTLIVATQIHLHLLPDGNPFGCGHGQHGDGHLDEPEEEGGRHEDWRQELCRLQR